ncbi:MAG TPA: PepSY domain-containing protein [Blastocatellia bacterium]|nr:PepSY domain-containing protein [Blastocatellia bacterium]
MKGRNQLRTLLTAALLFPGLALAQESEQKVRMKDLPPAVQATVKAQSKGAQIRGLSRETEKGQTLYEVELKISGHNKDVLIDESGKVISVEEQVTLDSLPAAVKAEIQKQAGRGRIAMIEWVTKDGTLAYYEAHIKGGGKMREIKVSPDGALVK